MWLLEICKATLKLSLSEKENTVTSSSDSETVTEPVRILSRRRKKKSKRNKVILDYSDSDTRMSKSQRSISVFDLIPSDSLESQLYTRRSKTPQPRSVAEKKCTITKQLNEVQAKLCTLRNKLWFGMGNGDAPLSWGKGNKYFSNDRSESPQKKNKSTRKQKKQDKSEKKNSNKDLKPKQEQKEKTTKNQNGLRRQVAVDWTQGERGKIRKSKSLPDTSSSDLVRSKVSIAVSGDEEKQDRKKKKKRSGKFVRKAKIVTNAKTFTKKD